MIAIIFQESELKDQVQDCILILAALFHGLDRISGWLFSLLKIKHNYI